jgi:MFS family permease
MDEYDSEPKAAMVAIQAIDNEPPTNSNKIDRITKLSSITTVLVSGVALFSDGYNAQIIGYMNLVLAELYPITFTSVTKTRLSNAYLIGEIFGMLFFGYAIDRLGRRTGIFFATLFLVLGIIIATAAHGTTERGMFWMVIVGRGVSGFGAGGESIQPPRPSLLHFAERNSCWIIIYR